jgi:2-aminoadipate transaminase
MLRCVRRGRDRCDNGGVTATDPEPAPTSIRSTSAVGHERRAALIGQTTLAWAAAGVIDFGIGHPQDAILPVNILRHAAARVMADGDAYPLQYGTEMGDGYLRLALAAFLTDTYGLPVEPEPIYITNGNSQALDQVCSVFTEPGDVVFVEEPSYFLALGIFRHHHLRIVGIPVDEQGLRIDALDAALATERPAFLYTIPTFQNPTGFTLPVERRERLVALAQEHEFLIVADEVYHLLSYGATPPPPMATYIESGVVLSLGTFTKILAPGLRLGWIQGDMPLLRQLADSAFMLSGGGLNPFTSAIVRTVIEQGDQHSYLAFLRGIYRDRVAVMDAALRHHFPATVTYDVPDGGYFFWLRFPDGIDTATFLPAAADHKVGFRCGSKFTADASLANYMRLSFAYYDSPTIERGIAALAQAIGNG